MKESATILAVERKLPKSIHHQSMTLGARTHTGTPDQYYDGLVADLWAEWKQLDAMPRSKMVGGVTPMKERKSGMYTTRQFVWMKRRWTTGKNVLGLIGLPDRTVVIQRTPEEWELGSCITAAVSIEEVAYVITRHCNGEDNAEQVLVGSNPNGRRSANQRSLRSGGVRIHS